MTKLEIPLLLTKREDEDIHSLYVNAPFKPPWYSRFTRVGWLKYEIGCNPHIYTFFKSLYPKNNRLKTDKFAKFVFNTDPELYFRWQHLDPAILKASQTKEEALLAAIASTMMTSKQYEYKHGKNTSTTSKNRK